MRLLGESPSAGGTPSEVEEPSARGSAVIAGPDVLVHHVRPTVADLVRPGRLGLGTLSAPADSLVIVDGLGYRLDAAMAISRASSLERVRCAAERTGSSTVPNSALTAP